jgi:integrase
MTVAGRPGLRIGQNGKIKRINLGGGIWLARCRFRDSDGVIRIVERRGPAGVHDQYGKQAEETLLEALAVRPARSIGDITAATTLSALVGRYLDQLESRETVAETTLDTYRVTARRISEVCGAIRVGEANAGHMDTALQTMRTRHGSGMARHARAVLRGALQLAIQAQILTLNPMRDVSAIKSTKPVKGAPPLTDTGLRDLLAAVRGSEYCQQHDLVDPITMAIATGLRRGELLGLRWCDYDPDNRIIAVTGRVYRATGKGLKRKDTTKTPAGIRTLALPMFAVEMLNARRLHPTLGQHEVIFTSGTGTLRDPNNYDRAWRRVRDDIKAPDVTGHSFRKTIATIIDDEGFSPRVGADQLGHAKVSMTQDVYMARGGTHPVVADLMDRRINDE